MKAALYNELGIPIQDSEEWKHSPTSDLLRFPATPLSSVYIIDEEVESRINSASFSPDSNEFEKNINDETGCKDQNFYSDDYPEQLGALPSGTPEPTYDAPQITSAQILGLDNMHINVLNSNNTFELQHNSQHIPPTEPTLDSNHAVSNNSPPSNDAHNPNSLQQCEDLLREILAQKKQQSKTKKIKTRKQIKEINVPIECKDLSVIVCAGNNTQKCFQFTGKKFDEVEKEQIGSPEKSLVVSLNYQNQTRACNYTDTPTAIKVTINKGKGNESKNKGKVKIVFPKKYNCVNVLEVHWNQQQQDPKIRKKWFYYNHDENKNVGENNSPSSRNDNSINNNNTLTPVSGQIETPSSPPNPKKNARHPSTDTDSTKKHIAQGDNGGFIASINDRLVLKLDKTILYSDIHYCLITTYTEQQQAQQNPEIKFNDKITLEWLKGNSGQRFLSDLKPGQETHAIAKILNSLSPKEILGFIFSMETPKTKVKAVIQAVLCSQLVSCPEYHFSSNSRLDFTISVSAFRTIILNYTTKDFTKFVLANYCLKCYTIIVDQLARNKKKYELKGKLEVDLAEGTDYYGSSSSFNDTQRKLKHQRT